MSKLDLTIPGSLARLYSITPGAKLLYSALCYFSAQNGGDHCSPSQAELSVSIGQSVRSVQKHLQTLAQEGYIQVAQGGRSYQILKRPSDSRRRKAKANFEQFHNTARHDEMPGAVRCA